MSRRPSIREAGISLVELLLGLAITALVMAPLVPMLQTASAAMRIAGDRIGPEREADFALERIAARIRATKPSPQLLGKDSKEWLKPAEYMVTGSTLVEKQGNDSHILAESIKKISFATSSIDAAQPAIVVVLERDDATSTTVTAIVRMGSAL